MGRCGILRGAFFHGDDGVESSAMKTVMVCVKRRGKDRPNCGVRGEALAEALERLLAERGVAAQVMRSTCLGCCELGPNLRLVGGRFFYGVGEAALPAVAEAVAQEAGKE